MALIILNKCMFIAISIVLLVGVVLFWLTQLQDYSIEDVIDCSEEKEK